MVRRSFRKELVNATSIVELRGRQLSTETDLQFMPDELAHKI